MFFIQDFEGKNVSLVPTDAGFEEVKDILEANECVLAKFGRSVIKQIDYSTWPVEKIPHVVKRMMCLGGELHDPEIENELEEERKQWEATEKWNEVNGFGYWG